MPNLYEQLGQQMSSAIGYGAEGGRFWELDQIHQLYDRKRERMNRLFESLGYGLEAAGKLKGIYDRNKRLGEWAESKGYKMNAGFLGLGTPTFKKKFDEYGREYGKTYRVFNETDIGHVLKYERDYKMPESKKYSMSEVAGFGKDDFLELTGRY